MEATPDLNEKIDCRGIGYKCLRKKVLQNRYKIIDYISSGSNGKVFLVTDEVAGGQYALKLQENQELMSDEIYTINKINHVINQYKAKNILQDDYLNNCDSCVPRIIAFGTLLLYNFNQVSDDPQTCYQSIEYVGYYIMPFYEMTLYSYLENFTGLDRMSKILHVVHELIAIFKYVHSAKRTYNDLKPDNIMINVNQQGVPSVNLIDYGFSAKYESGNPPSHVPEDQKIKAFRGNILFSTLRQVQFKVTSRKDDLISLFYLMVYLLNHNQLLGNDELVQRINEADEIEGSVEDIFRDISIYKQKYSLTDLAVILSQTIRFGNPIFTQSDKIQFLKNQFFQEIHNFATQIDEIPFNDRAQYSVLRKTIAKSMEIMNQIDIEIKLAKDKQNEIYSGFSSSAANKNMSTAESGFE